METLSEKQPIARKDHRCDWCGEIIHKGEKYDYAFNIMEGFPFVWENHLSCRQIAIELDMFDNVNDGVTEEDFREFIQDEYRNIMLNHYHETYAFTGFVYPPFSEQLELVKKFHQIK